MHNKFHIKHRSCSFSRAQVNKMANDAHEEFWGCTLSGNKKEYLWDPATDSEEDVEHKLQLNTACLGHKAKDGQRHVVEVTTQDDDGKKVTCPIVSLRVGGTECIHIDLGFYNTTKFVLKEGAGPLSLCGVHLKALPLDFDENDDSSEDEDIPDLVSKPTTKKEVQKPEAKKVAEKKDDKKNKPVEQKTNKRTLSDAKEDQPSKKKKPDPEPVEESEDDEEEEDDDEEEEDEDSEDEEMPSLLDGEAEEADSDEESEEDEELEGDDLDSDDDEEDEDDDEEGDDDEEEEEEEEEVKPKKKQMNGHATKQTPAKQKQKEEQKTPSNKTPGKKENIQTPKSQAKKTPAELKSFLLKSPNLPKKFDKFANFMKNNMKVTDEKSQKELWDYVQKNKK